MSADTIAALVAADVPVLLWGPPGSGKSASVMAMAAAGGAACEVLIGSQIDPTDVGGLPVPDAAGQVQLSAPPWARRIRAALDVGRPAWLFLDELSCAPPGVQAALLRVVQERHAAGIDLRGCRMVAAANPADTAADGGTLSAATASRWAHVRWRVDPEAWVSGLLGGWGVPWVGGASAVAASVAAWIGRAPDALCPAAPSDSSRGYPTPRGWHAVVRAVGPLGVRHPLARPVASAIVGAAAAGEWLTWAIAQDLPSPEDLLAGARWPQRADQVYTASLGLAAHVVAHPEAAPRAAERLVELRPDQAVPAARAIAAALEEIPAGLVPLGLAMADLRCGR